MIAIISMTFDHTGYLVFGEFSYFNYIGRLAFPIFAFQISQGYTHTKNLTKYFSRLCIFAIISQVPFMLFLYSSNTVIPISKIPSTLYSLITTGNPTLNIFFTLAIGLAAIMVFDKIKYKSLGILVGISFAFLGHYINVDYGFYGVIIILLFYLFRNNKLIMALSFILVTVLNYIRLVWSLYTNFYSKGIDISGYITTYVILCICTMLSLFCICLYNGKKGRNTKRLLYFFYPIHLLLIYFCFLMFS